LIEIKRKRFFLIQIHIYIYICIVPKNKNICLKVIHGEIERDYILPSIYSFVIVGIILLLQTFKAINNLKSIQK
jgi:hypothetical protein